MTHDKLIKSRINIVYYLVPLFSNRKCRGIFKSSRERIWPENGKQRRQSPKIPKNRKPGKSPQPWRDNGTGEPALKTVGAVMSTSGSIMCHIDDISPKTGERQTMNLSNR
ncbi:MAG: hypothetical protein VCF08_07925, partial [Alphaproteobacteria bacterium]